MKFSVKKVAKRFGFAAFLFFFIKGLVWLAVFFGLAKLIFPDNAKTAVGELSVWHASVVDTNDQLLQFKMVVPDTLQDTMVIMNYGWHFLQEKVQKEEVLSIKYCPTCKIEHSKILTESIKGKGYAIIP